MPMVSSVKMIEVRLVEEWITPAVGSMSGIISQKMNTTVNSHEVHSSVQAYKASNRNHPKPYRPPVQYIPQPPFPPPSHTVLTPNDSKARHTIYKRIYLPMSTEAERQGCKRPSTLQCTVKCEEHEEGENRFRGATCRDREYERIEEMNRSEEGCLMGHELGGGFRTLRRRFARGENNRNEQLINQDAR